MKRLQKREQMSDSHFMHFFHNKNDDPMLLMQVATWWIETHRLNHFEKALNIKEMVLKRE